MPAIRYRRRFLLDRLETRTLLTTLPTPVGYWAFDEGHNASAADSSGNAHTATLSANASWTTGNVGANALTLNGSNSSVAIATGPIVNTSQSFSVSAWVKVSTLGGFQTFVSNSGVNVAGYFLQLRNDTGTFAFTKVDADSTSASSGIASSSTAPIANQWYHLVGVNDVSTSTISLYIDGQLSATAASSGNWAATGDTLIGQGFYNGGRVDYVNGAVDDVKLFAAALSADQVRTLDYSAAYPLNEGAGTTSTDDSGNARNLTLGSGASWTAGHIGSGALDLNGTTAGNATAATAVLDTSMPFSVSAWVKLDSLGASQTFASIDGVRVSGFYLQYRADTGKFAFTRLASDTTIAASYHADALAAPVTGTWYHLLGVSDRANGRILLYVNGELQTSITAPSGWRATGTTVIGGGRNNSVRSDAVDGQVDDVRFFNAALSAQAAAWLPYIGTPVQNIINVATQTSGITVSPDLFGLFMEDINYGGEGGVYNDEVRNGGLNDSTNALNAWTAVTSSGAQGTLTSDATTGPTAALTKSGKLSIASGVSATSRAGIANSGFFGVAVAPSTSYDVEFYAKATANFGSIRVALESNGGTVYASATVASLGTTWAKYTATLTTGVSVPLGATNRFVISTTNASANGGTLWLGAAHVFPPSYKNSSAHLRVDLMDMLAAMKPAIFRVPGGNYLEGNTYADRFNWSQTIGPIENRPGHFNSAWGYWSSDGMGLDEYLQMAELVNARPIVAVYAGYTLNGTSDTGATLTADVASAVNELHYLLDPVTTTWGALRATNGHAAPYDVHEVEIGNEDFFSSNYSTRYPLFYDAIRAAFPTLQLIATSTDTGGRPYDIIDEHYYLQPSVMQSNQNFYDNRSRSGAKVFVGEWASMAGSPTNNMTAALGDATWLLGLMENSDLVTMSSYAPLWANVNGIQWTPDLIGFNNTTAYGSPSYWAQVMLSNQHGTAVVSNSLLGGASGLRTSVTKTGDTYYVAVVNVGGSEVSSAIDLNGVSTVWPTATVTTLAGASTTATNSINAPTSIVPHTYTLDGVTNGFTYAFPAYSFTILQLTANNSALGNVPTVANAAAASPAVVNTSTTLSVLGADVEGEANLSYLWRTIGTSPASVAFSINGTNAAKTTAATFKATGHYQFQVTITDATGRAATSIVGVDVVATPTGYLLSPHTSTIQPGSVIPFSLLTLDQFGNALNQSIAGTIWSATAGVITQAGVFTAPLTAGTAQITVNAPGMASHSAILTVASALIASYQADTTSGTSLIDASGNNKTATLEGSSAFGTGFVGNGLVLTGGDASLPAGILSSATDFTVAMWVKLTSLDNWARLFDFGTGTVSNMFLTASAGSTGALRFAITTNGGGGEQVVDGPTLSINVWTHIAIALVGSTATLYVNGVPVGSNNNMTLHPADLGVTTQNYIGKSQYAADPALRGTVDDFRLYGAGLSQAEINSLYRAWRMPTVATSATATPSPVAGTSTVLKALGASPDGESTLTYIWSVIGTPPASVTFDVNGTNAAKNSVARFTASGNYVFRVDVIDATGAAAASTVTVSVTVPAASIVSAAHGYLTAQNTLTFKFSRDVGQQDWLALLEITRIGGGASIAPVAATYDAATQSVQFTLPAGITDGRYHAVLNKGSFLAADAALDFFSLVADFNHDGVVDFDDLLILAQNYNRSPRTFVTGDANYDGQVNFDDLLLLAQRYGTALPAITTSTQPTKSRGTVGAGNTLAADILG